MTETFKPIREKQVKSERGAKSKSPLPSTSIYTARELICIVGHTPFLLRN